MRRFRADDCFGLAQQVAFSAVLAFFPAAAALLGLLGILGLFDEVESLLSTVAPHGVISFVEGLRRDTHRGSALLFVVGLATAVWAASGAMGNLIKAVNRAYERTESRPFWRLRLVAIALVVASAIVLAGTLALIVFGGPLGTAIANRAGLGSAFTVLWNVLRWPLVLAAVLVFLGLVYTFGPDVSTRTWKWITPGAVLAGFLWLALSGLFALYVTFVGSYSKTYGTLASGVILLLWLNYSAMALLFGAELNSELDRRAR